MIAQYAGTVATPASRFSFGNALVAQRNDAAQNDNQRSTTRTDSRRPGKGSGLLRIDLPTIAHWASKSETETTIKLSQLRPGE